MDLDPADARRLFDADCGYFALEQHYAANKLTMRETVRAPFIMPQAVPGVLTLRREELEFTPDPAVVERLHSLARHLIPDEAAITAWAAAKLQLRRARNARQAADEILSRLVWRGPLAGLRTIGLGGWPRRLLVVETATERVTFRFRAASRWADELAQRCQLPTAVSLSRAELGAPFERGLSRTEEPEQG